MIKKILTAAVLVAGVYATEAQLFAVQSQPIVPVTLSYGPDAKNTLDFWQAGGQGPGRCSFISTEEAGLLGIKVKWTDV